MKKLIFLVIAIVFLVINCIAQNKSRQNSKFFLCAGYGFAGSFFVRSYDEFAPLSYYKTYYNKRFIGVVQNAALGMNLKKNWDIKLGINFQYFTRHIISKDTLNSVQINLDHTIHHRDFMWYGSINKKLDQKKYLLSFGLGLYYLLPKQEEVEIFYPNYFADLERDQENSNLREGGTYIEFTYEYKFQPKVNLGIKTQFYYTLSTGEPESVTLFPYVKILF
jgi:hypothetical protein